MMTLRVILDDDFFNDVFNANVQAVDVGCRYITRVALYFNLCSKRESYLLEINKQNTK